MTELANIGSLDFNLNYLGPVKHEKSSFYYERINYKIVMLEKTSDSETPRSDISLGRSLQPRNFGNNVQNFEFPRHDYEVICKIIGSLVAFRDRSFNIQFLSDISGLSTSIILANLGFLRSISIISGNGDRIPSDSILMAAAIRLGNTEEVDICWRRLIEKSHTIKSLLEWISQNRKVWFPRLLIYFVSTSNRELSRKNIKGAKYVTEILLKTGFLVKNGTYLERGIITAHTTIPGTIASMDKKSESGTINLHFHFNSPEIPFEIREVLEKISRRIG